MKIGDTVEILIGSFKGDQAIILNIMPYAPMKLFKIQFGSSDNCIINYYTENELKLIKSKQPKQKNHPLTKIFA